MEEDEYTMTRPTTSRYRVDRATISLGHISCAGALLRNDLEGDLLRLGSVFRSRGIACLRTPLSCPLGHQMLEHLAALFEAAELVEGRAGGGKREDIARLGVGQARVQS